MGFGAQNQLKLIKLCDCLLYRILEYEYDRH